jgi:drug/metabolite transporter (DMT)-like permease
MRERLTPVKVICVLAAFVGAALVSGVGADMEGGQLRCVLFASIAAIFYASVTLTTKTMRDIPSKDCTVVQLLVAAAFLLPYTLIFERSEPRSFDTVTVLCLLAVGLLHTGVAFGLYFYSVGRLPAFSVSLYSYLDPVVAIVLSAIVFREKLGLLGVIGAVLVIGAAVVGEIHAFLLKKGKKKKGIEDAS